jgi:transketolase
MSPRFFWLSIFTALAAAAATAVAFDVLPAPTIASLSPNPVDAGGVYFRLAVNGAGFVARKVVNCAGTPLDTIYVGSTQLQAAITPELRAPPHNARVLESYFHMAKSIPELQSIAKVVRRDIVTMITAAKSGHPGGSLSAVELLVELYFNHMRIDPANPKWADRDRFILSKGHAAPVLYSVMAERGYADAPKEKLNTLRQFGSVFQGHPDMRFIPSLEASTGSLGQGLSLGLGMALAARLDARPSRYFVMMGDGEVQEGQIWEAAMAGAFHKADNLVAIVDYNRIQLDGFVSDIMEIAPLAAKWREFGWHTMEIDGHDFTAIEGALAEAAATKGKPSCIVAHTVKGKGVSFMENNPKFHGVAPTQDELKLALQELN